MRRDPRWQQLAASIADGVGIRAGMRVSITLTAVEAFDAVAALVEEVHTRAAVAEVLLVDERFDRSALQHAPRELLATVPALEHEAMRWSDAHVAVRGMLPPDDRIEDVSDDRFQAQRSAKGRISTLRWEETAWCIVRVPTPAWAEMIGIAHAAMLDEFFAGCAIDVDRARHEWGELAERWSGGSIARIVSSDTDLTLRIAGRRWIVFAGEANLPDGELATAPHEDGVDGHITFDDPAVFAGRRVRGLRLVFRAGEVVEVDAEEGAGLARSLIATDDGSRRVGELGVGVNPRMRTLTQDLFLDEKILGTVHLALGRAYPECGGTNRSTLHWDLVKDLRPRPGRAGGTLLLDAEALIDQGAATFVTDSL